MLFLWILLAVLAIVLIISYFCFRMAFYVPKKVVIGPDDYPLPRGKIYEPYREQMIAWMKEVRALPRQHVSIRSHDGLTLHGTYYECSPGAPVEIMFHGYRGNAERDLCGGVQRAFALGHSALIVDQRAANRSDGRIISFGVNESRDCLAWVDFMVRSKPDVRIILTGISMGATTVLMAAGQPLPENVVGVLADCGFTSAKEMIQLVIQRMKLPPKIAYPFVVLGAAVFGGFRLSHSDAKKAIARCKLPVIFFHGDADDFVPCQMSRDNFDACGGKKRLVIIPGAGHGLCYLVDPEGYVQAMREFFGPDSAASMDFPTA